MTLVTTSMPSGVALSPEDRAALIVEPLERESLALRTSRVLRANRDQLQVPLLTEDVPAGFVAEGAELPQGEPTVNEKALCPNKIAAMTTGRDSEREAADLIGQSIARSIRLKLD